MRQRLALALAAYAVLAVLAWETLSDAPIRVAGLAIQLRLLTLIVLGLFAFRTLVHFWRWQADERESRREP